MGDSNKKTILVVEDEPDVQDYLKTILEDAGFSVLTASDGESGLNMIKEIKPDLVSLDLVLPKMSGRKVLRALKNDKEVSHIPVLVVTAHAHDDLGNDGEGPVLESVLKPPQAKENSGMYMHKPVKPLEYVRCIEEILNVESSAESKLRLEAKSELDDLAKDASYEKLEAALKLLRKG